MALKLASIVSIGNGYLVIGSDPTNGTDSEAYYFDLPAALDAIKARVVEAEAVIAKAKQLAASVPADIVSPKDFARQLENRKRGR